MQQGKRNNYESARAPCLVLFRVSTVPLFRTRVRHTRLTKISSAHVLLVSAHFLLKKSSPFPPQKTDRPYLSGIIILSRHSYARTLKTLSNSLAHALLLTDITIMSSALAHAKASSATFSGLIRQRKISSLRSSKRPSPKLRCRSRRRLKPW